MRVAFACFYKKITFWNALCLNLKYLLIVLNMNWTEYISFSDLFSVDLKTIYHLNLNFLIYIGILQVFRFEFLSSGFFTILNFHQAALE